MKTIEGRAKEAGIVSQYKSDYRYDTRSVESGYIQGATEQEAIDENKIREQKSIYIDKACNIFCYTGCPHKTDSYNCLNDKCDTWKIFRRMLEE